MLVITATICLSLREAIHEARALLNLGDHPGIPLFGVSPRFGSHQQHNDHNHNKKHNSNHKVVMIYWEHKGARRNTLKVAAIQTYGLIAPPVHTILELSLISPFVRYLMSLQCQPVSKILPYYSSPEGSSLAPCLLSY